MTTARCNNALTGGVGGRLSNFKEVPSDLCDPKEALRQKERLFTHSAFLL